MIDKIEYVEKEQNADLSTLELLIWRTIPSVVALACGKLRNGSVNVIGTGFSIAISPADKKSTIIATCTHVADEISYIRNLSKPDAERIDFIDNYYRIGLFECGKFSWKIVNIEIGDAFQNGDNYSEKHDACICKVPDLQIPSLSLSNENIRLGGDVSIIGYPTFGNLQLESLQPYVLKTIISSSVMYPFDRNGKTILSPRIALGCVVGSGFSGSPVVTLRDGSVIGMVDYLPKEVDIMDLKLIKPQPLEGDMRLQYPAGISLAIPATYIRSNLDGAIKHDMDTNSSNYN